MGLWDLAYDAAAGLVDSLWDSSADGAAANLADDPLDGWLGTGVALAEEALAPTLDMYETMFDAATSETGLGHDVDDLVGKSPTLSGNLEELRQRGYAIRYGASGGGSHFDPDTKTIVVDVDEAWDAETVVQTLAHESGHALYEKEPLVRMGSLSRDDYVDRNVMRDLKDEGEATIENLIVRNEILRATRTEPGGRVDIGVAGELSETYKRLYRRYPDPEDRDLLRARIGKLFAEGESPSGEDDETNYEEYYAESYETAWDNAHRS